MWRVPLDVARSWHECCLQLTTLDLSANPLEDGGAEAIAAHLTAAGCRVRCEIRRAGCVAAAPAPAPAF